MAIILTLLIFSISLNIALIFGIVRKNSDEDMDIIRWRESLNIERTEKF